MIRLLHSLWQNRKDWKRELDRKGELPNMLLLIVAAAVVIIVLVILIAKFTDKSSDAAGGMGGIFNFGTK